MSSYKSYLRIVGFGLAVAIGLALSFQLGITQPVHASTYGQCNYGNNTYQGNSCSSASPATTPPVAIVTTPNLPATGGDSNQNSGTLPNVTSPKNSPNAWLIGLSILVLSIILPWLIYSRRKKTV